MTLFLNRCVWNPTAGGLTDFVVASAFAGAYTPAQCLDPVVTDGGSYHYFAQTADNTQHEEGDGIYSVATSTLTRATIRNSSSGGVKVNFGQTPIVTMGGPTALDLASASGPGGPSGAVQYDNSGSFGGFGIYTPGTHTLQLDAADAASPNVQNLRAQNVLAGTLNTGAVTWNIQGSLSTGGTQGTGPSSLNTAHARPGSISFNTGFDGLANAGPIVCTFDIGGSRVLATNHGFPPNQPVYFTTTGNLPTGISPLTTYYVDPFSWRFNSPSAFKISATNGGSTISTSGTQSGINTVIAGGAVTISIASPAVITLPLHCIVPGQSVTFQTTGALPTGISAGVTYYVIYDGLGQNTFEISTTLNGPAVNTSGSQSGTQTIQIQGGTVQNPAEPAVVIGPAAGTLGASIAAGNFGPSALTVNMVNASSVLIPPAAVLINMWSISPYEIILFEYNDVPNNVARYFMNYTPGSDYSVAITGLSGESTRTGIFLNTDNNARLLFGLNASDVPGFGLGNGSLILDTFLARAAAGVWAIGTIQGNALGWFNYGGQTRVTADFPVTSSAVLVNVTGLSVSVSAGRNYQFEAVLFCTDAAAGGVQAAIAGTATATNIVYEGYIQDGNSIIANTRTAALGGVVASATTTGTAPTIRIHGLIEVNASGTLVVQFAQNTSNGTSSTVKRGSYFIVQDLQ